MLVLAQVAGPEWAVFVAQTGVAGGVLVWFMFRTENILKGMAAALDRFSRTILLLIIALKQAPPAVKESAHDIIREIDDNRTPRP